MSDRLVYSGKQKLTLLYALGFIFDSGNDRLAGSDRQESKTRAEYGSVRDILDYCRTSNIVCDNWTHTLLIKKMI